jgi:hypothetical protein
VLICATQRLRHADIMILNMKIATIMVVIGSRNPLLGICIYFKMLGPEFLNPF